MTASGTPEPRLSPFQDLFSAQAATYADIRPNYPPALFEFLSSVVEQHRLAWDCATGNGQAAESLAAHFEHVIATDASEAQLAQARPNPRIEYRVATAEASGLSTGVADLVTVAQALHWFDRDRFYAEATRVLVRRGVLAVWSYGDPTIAGDVTLDAALQHFNLVTLGPYWPSGRGLVGTGYRRIPFPFEEITAPPIRIVRAWTLPQFAQYLRSWSSRARYLERNGTDPVSPFLETLEPMWGGLEAKHEVRWEVTIRVGRS